MELPFAEPYKIKMVESIQRSTREEREKWISDANFNVFNLQSNQVYIDLLTDSGTGAMSDRQWAAVMSADESYAGASSFTELKEAISVIMGFPFVLPTHQGRAAENVLFSATVNEGDRVPGNSHFDTTKGHIEFRKARAIDCTIDEAFDTECYHPFKGNLDLQKLRSVLEENRGHVPFVLITVTCNSSGGQPVSMENIRAVKRLADEYDTPLCFDSARFAENAYFIKMREEEFANKTIKEIVKEMYSYADMTTMSAKKDGIVNMGGFIGLKSKEVYDKASVFAIMYEGFVTYGGMSGKDMSALAVGLDESTEFDYLQSRVTQVGYLGQRLIDWGIPVQQPIGGHAVFINAKKFLPHVSQEEFIAQTIVVEVYKEAGIRSVEVGTLLADRDPDTRENRYPTLEFVRLAVPRRTYTMSHMEYVAAAIKNVWDRRHDIKSGYRIVSEAPIMRHFTVALERIE